MYFQIPGSQVRVLGSMHMVPIGAEPVPEWAAEAYAWATDLVIEHDPPALLPLFMGPGTLRGSLSSGTYEQLEAIWPEQGPLSPLSRLRPWAALISLAAILQEAAPGIEPTLLSQAAADGKHVGYLETPDAVSSFFDAASVEEIEASLQAVLADRELIQTKLVEMYAAWLTRDRASLFEVTKDAPLFAYSTLRRAVLDNRNRAWVPEIERLLNGSTPTLVVVGALHLCGPGNLEELLGRPFLPVRSVG